jgi:hypothetical protein
MLRDVVCVIVLLENHWYKVEAVVCVVSLIENPGTKVRGCGSALLC